MRQTLRKVKLFNAEDFFGPKNSRPLKTFNDARHYENDWSENWISTSPPSKSISTNLSQFNRNKVVSFIIFFNCYDNWLKSLNKKACHCLSIPDQWATLTFNQWQFFSNCTSLKTLSHSLIPFFTVYCPFSLAQPCYSEPRKRNNSFMLTYFGKQRFVLNISSQTNNKKRRKTKQTKYKCSGKKRSRE